MACLLIQEFAVRLALPEYNPANHLSFSREINGIAFGTPHSTQRHVKNTGDFNVEVRFNRFGLRESNDLSMMGDQDFLVLGDSFGFGWGVEAEDRFSERLAPLVGRKIYNASSPAGAVDHYSRMIAFLRSQGATSKRAIVALNFETDLIPYRKAPPKLEPEVRRLPGLQSIKSFLLKHSAMYFATTSLAQQTPWLRAPAEYLGLIRATLPSSSKRIPDASIIHQTIERLKLLADAAETTVMVIPSRHLWFGNDKASVATAYSRFILEAGQAGLDIVDLRHAFQASGEPLSYHFKNDAHWRPEGHRLAALILNRHLRKRYGNAL